ncbi:MAG: type I-B CRISPR-associated protein Cas5 [Candidatus Aenigmarchaeota archaeon]|nr:type I-B CRISPR-associated protein Cas5 [Candidatus Aenigmarchaeota archaeon]
MKDRVLVFDIWGDFAHFRRFETTTSPLTYPFPTGSAIAGLLAAILGFPRDSYYTLFCRDNIEYSIRILNPIKKIVIPETIIKTDEGFYLWDIKDKQGRRAPTPYEFVKEPKYRIYVRFKNSVFKKLYEKLKGLLEDHQTVYTPYLGITEMIANFEFVDEFSAVPLLIKDEAKDLHSIARIDMSKIVPEEGKRYGRETVPLCMDSDRKVLEYCNVVYEVNGKSIKIRSGTIYEVGDEYVSFL